MKITFLTVFPDLVKHVSEAAKTIDPSHDLLELHFFNSTTRPTPEELEALTRAIHDSDIVVLDAMGGDPQWIRATRLTLDDFDGAVLSWGAEFIDKVRLGSFSMATARNAIEKTDSHADMKHMPPDMKSMLGNTGAQKSIKGILNSAKKMIPIITEMGSSTDSGGEISGINRVHATVKGMRTAPKFMADAKRFSALGKAFHSMREPQADFFLRHLLHFDRGHPEVVVPTPPEALAPASVGAPWPSRHFSTVEKYRQECDAPHGRPTVVLLYSGLTYPYDSNDVVRALMDSLRKDCWVVPISIVAAGGESLEALRTLLSEAAPKLIISMQGFRIGGGPMGGDVDSSTAMLKSINAPIMHPLILSRYTEKQWNESRHGLGQSEAMVMLMLPEMDGCLAEIPIAAMTEPAQNTTTGVVTSVLVPIPKQIERFARRVRGQLRLSTTPAPQKRIALIGYDYPAGEGNLLNGAFLDVSESMAAIMRELSHRGYQTKTPSGQQLLNDLLAQAVNSPEYSQTVRPKTYLRADAEQDLPHPRAWQSMDETHPSPSDCPMTTPEGDFIIPAVDYGNVLVGIQPGRGSVKMATTDTHDTTRPPHPQYAGFYTWLSQVWKPDVIIHVGTHGTLEFLQGKENAVSAECFPDMLIGDIPHVYIYYCGNAAEGLIARRRAHAVLVSYQPPVMQPTRLDGELAELDDLISEYRRSVTLMPQTSAELLEQVHGRATALHLPTDLDELEVELARTKRSLVPMGLHVWGQAYTPQEARLMVRGMAEHGSFDGELAPALSPSEQAKVVGKVLGEVSDSSNETSLPEKSVEPKNPEDEALTQGVGYLASWARNLYARLQHNDEIEGLFHALEGRHVDARLGGDPIRNPEVLPSGHSLYQFDSRRVPTPIAVRRGRDIANHVCSAYRASHDGADPTTIAVVLWGLETTRTQGETYAQILSLLGVRSLTPRRPNSPHWEIIPSNELERPRVDVVVTICGFFRDLFSNLIDELDDILHAVAALDEPADINPLAARTRQQAQAMRQSGEPEERIEALAHARIFGPPPGQYGSGLTDIVDSGQWQSPEDLATAFTAASGHVYTRYDHGSHTDGLYDSRLKDVDLVSQTRSSNEYEITDLDHYFEYLGGLGNSVRAAKGTSIPILVTDTTQDEVYTTSVGRAAAKGLRTRLLNKDWMEAMLAHGHRGVTEIEKRVTNLVGLAATTDQIDDWMFDEVCDTYIDDPEMVQRLSTLNPHSLASMAQRMVEAHDRSLWNASAEHLDKLHDLTFKLDSSLEAGTQEIDYP